MEADVEPEVGLESPECVVIGQGPATEGGMQRPHPAGHDVDDLLAALQERDEQDHGSTTPEPGEEADRRAARGDPPEPLTAPTEPHGDQNMNTLAENSAVLRCLWPGADSRDRGGGDAVRVPVLAAHLDKLADAEQKAAKRLNTFPLAVAAAARKRWGRSFTEERDRRVAEQASPNAELRTLQAFRGHAARAMLDELRRENIAGLRVTTSTKRR